MDEYQQVTSAVDLLGQSMRYLADDEEAPARWELIFMSFVMIIMFAALITDRVAPDHVFVTALAFCMVTGIVDSKEGLGGFANEGVLTVMVLFVVAHGLTMTGAVDWYIGKLLGVPKSSASAQLRLSLSCAFVSAFLNNTPIVALMIPIVLRWSKTIRVSAQQLLIPLSYGTILGGTCTLIGTSTNLVISGLLEDEYSVPMNLFDVTPYGVPVAIMGIAYIIIFGPFLLPGGHGTGGSPFDGDEILLGARVTSWSPAAGRSVKRSGLRDTGGLYLVSVRRAATGNIHRAVGQDFVLNVNDVVYFSGLIEEFGEFCHEHGLELLTNESTEENTDNTVTSLILSSAVNDGGLEGELLQANDEENVRRINLMTDIIQGVKPVKSMKMCNNERAEIVLSKTDNRSKGSLLIGINARDRTGLLLDISRSLLRLDLQIHRTEAAVFDGRSISVWRCTCVEKKEPDSEQLTALLSAVLEDNSGMEAVKRRGLKVLRATVTKSSRLIGQTAVDVQFSKNYKAAIVAVQQGGKNVAQPLSALTFGAGDVLVLQVNDDCPLLSPSVESSRTSILASITTKPKSTGKFDPEAGWSFSIEGAEAVRRDLKVLSTGKDGSSSAPESKEFLVAMRVTAKSVLSKKNIEENGITRVPGVYVVSIERPISHGKLNVENLVQNEGHLYYAIDPEEPLQDGDVLWFAGDAPSVGDLRKIPGLESPEEDEIEKMNESIHNRRLIQAVVARSGPLVGKSVRDVAFRTKYGAAVISVHREGHRVHEHPGNIKLHAGDVLLLEAGPTFIKKSANSDYAFALLAEVKDSAPPRMKYLIPAILLMVAMLVVSGLDYETAPLLICATFAGILMVAIGLLSPQEARDAIDWSLFVAIACSFGISKALTNSGLAEVCANFLISVGEGSGLGATGVFGAVYFATALISSFVTNNAAAALMFPIAIGAADTAGIDLKIMSYALMLGASDFSTPFGYQTNLMVYGPGGYKTIDYLKFGTPLQFVLWLTSTWVLSTPSRWYINLGITVVILVVVVVVRFGNAALLAKIKSGGAQDRFDQSVPIINQNRVISQSHDTDKESEANFNDFMSSIYGGKTTPAAN